MTTTDRPIRDCKCVTVKHRHGTNHAYVTDKCRCGPCTRAMRVYAKRRLLRGTPAYIDATDARDHLSHLIDGYGATIVGTAKAAHLNASTIRHLYEGQEHLSRRAYDRIMSLTLDDYPGECIVSARGTVRRVQALHCLGWGTGSIEAATGVTLRHCMKDGGRRIDLHGHRAIEAFYDTHSWAGPRPTSTPAEKSAATKAARLAARKQWAPPAAWDDIDLDLRPYGMVKAA